MNNLVSVITVVYNSSKGLERTIRSVISQTYENIEYIVVDGGSTDGTVDVINKYSDHINKWVSEPDNGIYDAMNKGIKMASGEWINIMNAGDSFADDDVLIKVFSEKIPDNISFLYSDVYSLKANGEKILRPMSFEKGILIHQGIIYRSKLHDIYGPYIVTPKIIVSDYLFFLCIPIEQVRKIYTVIALYEGGGVSQQGNWALQQSYCADVVFRRRTFWGMVCSYCWKSVKSIIPVDIKDKIKDLLGIKGEIKL